MLTPSKSSRSIIISVIIKQSNDGLVEVKSMLKAICVGSRVIAWECDLIDLKNIITSIASCNVEEIPFSAEFEPISPKVGECIVCYLKSADQSKGIEVDVIVEGHNSAHFTIKVIWSDEKLPCFLWVKYFCEKESVFHEVSMSPG